MAVKVVAAIVAPATYDDFVVRTVAAIVRTGVWAGIAVIVIWAAVIGVPAIEILRPRAAAEQEGGNGGNGEQREPQADWVES